MTHQEWMKAIAPKVNGSWILHDALENSQPDFFVVFSSLSGLCGQVGQANYAAANSFLDAFVQYRRTRGLPASVLDLRAMEDLGLVAQDPKLLARIRAGGVRLLQEKELMDALQLVISQSKSDQTGENGRLPPSVIGLGMSLTKPINSPFVSPAWGQDARFAAYENFETQGEGDQQSDTDDNVRDLMVEVENDPEILNRAETQDRLRKETGKLLAAHRNQGEGLTDEQMNAIVIDSIMSIEIRTWCRQRLGVEVSVTEISKAETAGGLGDLLIAKLREKYLPEWTG
jgi:acyl carrier protein